MLDLLERQWHTGCVVSALTGGELEQWADVQANFDAYLAGELVEDDTDPKQAKEEEMRGLLGLSGR